MPMAAHLTVFTRRVGSPSRLDYPCRGMGALLAGALGIRGLLGGRLCGNVFATKRPARSGFADCLSADRLAAGAQPLDRTCSRTCLDAARHPTSCGTVARRPSSRSAGAAPGDCRPARTGWIGGKSALARPCRASPAGGTACPRVAAWRTGGWRPVRRCSIAARAIRAVASGSRTARGLAVRSGSAGSGPIWIDAVIPRPDAGGSTRARPDGIGSVRPGSVSGGARPAATLAATWSLRPPAGPVARAPEECRPQSWLDLAAQPELLRADGRLKHRLLLAHRPPHLPIRGRLRSHNHARRRIRRAVRAGRGDRPAQLKELADADARLFRDPGVLRVELLDIHRSRVRADSRQISVGVVRD